tara:strand:+ start:3197 stop:3841 length:645 start_codon:yes stop_codon:yes gene_type:complete
MAQHYFRQLPNIRYKSPLAEKYTNDNFVTTKNLFTRAKLRDDAGRDITFLRSYTIREGERPQDVADKMYGSPKYDWVVLITANIINVQTEWPLTGPQLYNFCVDKYGNDLNAIHHYETTEVKDKSGRLIMPEGKIVDSNFTIRHPDTHNITLNPVIGVNNFLMETRENEKKRNIKLMRSAYLNNFIMETRNSVLYTPSSQFESRFLKKAHNPDI